VSFIRNTRTDNQISFKENISMHIKQVSYKDDFNSVLIKLGNLSEIIITDEKPEGSVAMMTAEGEFYIPVGDSHNKEDELIKLQKELEYNQGFLISVMKKLNNERFTSKAPPQVIENENRKKADAETKIKSLEERITLLKQ